MAKRRIKTGTRLRDVATAAGVSNATVSAVVNGKAEHYGICPATRAKVETLIRQMGYSPSLAALDMVSGRNAMVALVISADMAGTDRLIAALEPELAKASLRLIVAVIPADPQAAAARITNLIQFGVAGMVICQTGSTTLPKLTCPAVMVGKSGAGLPSVFEDETEGGRLLARRLIEKGHRAIAIIGGATPQPPAVSGFLEACAQAGAAARLFTSVADFMATSGTATAVFCATPAALLELYSRAPAAGLHPGNDLAVVATDNLGVAGNLIPRPTVLLPDMARLGQAAAQLLQQAIQGTTPSDIRLPPVIADGGGIPVPAAKVTAVPIPPTSGGQISPSRDTPIQQEKPAPAMPPAAPPPVIRPAEPTPPPAPQKPIPATQPISPISSSETFQMTETVVSETTGGGLSAVQNPPPAEPETAIQEPVIPVETQPEPETVTEPAAPSNDSAGVEESEPVTQPVIQPEPEEPALPVTETPPPAEVPMAETQVAEPPPETTIPPSETFQMANPAPVATPSAGENTTQPPPLETPPPAINQPEPIAEPEPAPAIVAEPTPEPSPPPVTVEVKPEPTPVIVVEPTPTPEPAPPPVTVVVEPQPAVIIPPDTPPIIEPQPAPVPAEQEQTPATEQEATEPTTETESVADSETEPSKADIAP